MKHKIRYDVTGDGVTIWVNGTWVLDASCFENDMIIRVDKDRTKETTKSGVKFFKFVEEENENNKRIRS